MIQFFMIIISSKKIYYSKKISIPILTIKKKFIINIIKELALNTIDG